MKRILSCLSLLVMLALVLPLRPAEAAPRLLEDLHYQLAVLLWPDAATIRVTLKDQGRGHLIAEVLGQTQGFVKLISGNHRERLQSEMIWRRGRLVPLIYREESWQQGKHHLNEYRFDYARSMVVLWQLQAGKGLRRKWATTLHEQVYDPLSAFYNYRLKLLGPTREGETGTIPGIPYPRPESLEVRLGSKTKDGRQAMVSLANPVFDKSRGVVFVMINAQRVPQKAWTTVYGFKVTGELQPKSVIMPASLPGRPAATRPGHEPLQPMAARRNQP